MLLFAFYVCFVLDDWPQFMRHSWQRLDVYAIAHDVADNTDATPAEGLHLMQTAGMESGFYRKAKGKKGEIGPWQIMPPARSYGAKEALFRMRVQGMVGFVGCRHADDAVVLPEGTKTTCQKMVDNRIGPADRYLAEHRPPTTLEPENDYAGNP